MALHRQPLAGQRAEHDDDQRAEQHMHAQALVLGLATAHGRSQEKPGREERRRDPEHGQLQVPRATNGIGNPLRDGNAEERLTFDGVVRGQRAGQDLQHEEPDDHGGVLPHRAHGRRQLDGTQRIFFCRHRRRFVALAKCLVPNQRAHPSDKQHDADQRPQHIGRRRVIAHQLVVRPVVGVGDGQARALGGAGPGGPEEERGHGLALGGLRQRVGLQRIRLAQTRERGIVAEQRPVVRRGRGHRPRSQVGNDQHAALGVVAVGAHFFLHACLHRCPIAHAERIERLAVALRAQLVDERGGLAMQPIRGPIGRLVGAVAPNRSDLLAARALPHLLAMQDVRFGHEQPAVFGNDSLGNGRRLSVHLAAENTEHGKGSDEHHAEGNPELCGTVHDSIPFCPAPRASVTPEGIHMNYA